jgi:hypothetical protein
MDGRGTLLGLKLEAAEFESAEIYELAMDGAQTTRLSPQ